MHLPAATKAGGTCVGFPDVCKVPAPPGSPVPTPFPNIAQVRNAAGTIANVLVKNKEIVVETSYPTSSTGDEAGTLKGVASNKTGGKCRFIRGSSKVKARGKRVVPLLAPTSHNDNNLPTGGVHCAPSQTTVLVHP